MENFSLLVDPWTLGPPKRFSFWEKMKRPKTYAKQRGPVINTAHIQRTDTDRGPCKPT